MNILYDLINEIIIIIIGQFNFIVFVQLLKKSRIKKYLRFPMVDIESNPLYYAAVGGIILGIATSTNFMLRGKVTGMSGLVFSLASFELSMNYNHK